VYKIIAVVAFSTIAGAGAATGLAASASADADPTAIVKEYTATYTSPSKQSTRVHDLKAGSTITVVCFREGQVIKENAYWFMVNKDGKSAYVHRDSIIPPQVLPHC
jgi:hypothetical protein